VQGHLCSQHAHFTVHVKNANFPRLLTKTIGAVVIFSKLRVYFVPGK